MTVEGGAVVVVAAVAAVANTLADEVRFCQVSKEYE